MWIQRNILNIWIPQGVRYVGDIAQWASISVLVTLHTVIVLIWQYFTAGENCNSALHSRKLKSPKISYASIQSINFFGRKSLQLVILKMKYIRSLVDIHTGIRCLIR